LPEAPKAPPPDDWFTRPVLHVTDAEASVRFYVERLGFEVAWRHEDGGKLVVAEVFRRGCARILASTWPEKAGNGATFVSIDVPPPGAWARETRTS